MAKTKPLTKPLHLQKQKSQSQSAQLFGSKQSSDAWFGDEQLAESDEEITLWLSVKKTLIKFHDSSKEISIKSLVKFSSDSKKCGSVFLLGGGGATLPFEFAQRLAGMAKKAFESSDFLAAKVMILAAGLILQTKVTDKDGILKLMGKDDDDEIDAKDLADNLNFMHTAYAATETPDTMKVFLEQLNTADIKSRIASAEPLLEIIFTSANAEGQVVQSVNSLLNLNTVLSNYGISRISSVRIKHNGARLFQGGWKKSLADLGFVDNDVVEIEDIDAPSVPSGEPTRGNCVDITNNSKKRSKRKGKKKGKGKR